MRDWNKNPHWNKWEVWFAWHPVRFDDRSWIWLKKCERARRRLSRQHTIWVHRRIK